MVADGEHRSLRSIYATTRQTATRTAMLLAGLTDLPGVRIFQGIRTADGSAPPLPHAVSRGRHLILVESVAWPGGWYGAAPDGRIHCDGVYIGRSIGPLSTAVNWWSRQLPGGHRVSAMVVVHPSR
ncbi:hypothetical protein FHU28_002359 [Micromonospora echinospora]|uniref:Uncharacterized protein n=1 Tax=Micromonospora echinospora TaxID=1877 RepID=A0ABR6MD05_MICEC|nr:hypothetical protein [Micromonospora echinospora]MBB5112520.1 hypothetical protein [Micromonospora echinospora]